MVYHIGIEDTYGLPIYHCADCHFVPELKYIIFQVT